MFRAPKGVPNLKFSIPQGKRAELLKWRGDGDEHFVLWGTTFSRHGSEQEWFNSFGMTVNGAEVFNATNAGVEDVGHITLKIDGKGVSDLNVDKAGSGRPVVQHFVSSIHHNARPNLAAMGQVTTSFELSRFSGHMIGKRHAQNLKVRTSGNVVFSIYVSKAGKFDSEREQVKWRHLNLKLESGIPFKATGIFAELSGVAPLTSATRKLIRSPLPPSRMHKLEANVANPKEKVAVKLRLTPQRHRLSEEADPLSEESYPLCLQSTDLGVPVTSLQITSLKSFLC
jgi:hypothetical protein